MPEQFKEGFTPAGRIPVVECPHCDALHAFSGQEMMHRDERFPGGWLVEWRCAKCLVKNNTVLAAGVMPELFN